jgi:hypothetical protein
MMGRTPQFLGEIPIRHDKEVKLVSTPRATVSIEAEYADVR